jgi:hypothetical protein
MKKEDGVVGEEESCRSSRIAGCFMMFLEQQIWPETGVGKISLPLPTSTNEVTKRCKLHTLGTEQVQEFGKWCIYSSIAVLCEDELHLLTEVVVPEEQCGSEERFGSSLNIYG